MSAIENDSAFLALPSDLASEIMLRYLELHHQLVISATCRALHLLYYEKLRSLQLDSYGIFVKDSSVVALFLRKATNLQKLSVARCFSLSIPTLLMHPELDGQNFTLRSLDVSGASLPPGNMSIFRRLPDLASLDLSTLDSLTDDDMIELSECCSRLKKLYMIQLSRVTARGFAALTAANPALSVLNLTRCYPVDTQTLTTITSNCPNLKVLDISFCFRLGGIETARALAAAPNITKIAMRYIGLTDECVREISKVLPNLTSVNFGYTDVTDASIRHLAQCNKLTQLILWKCSKIKFSAIREIVEHCSITHLDVSGWGENVTDDDLKYLSNKCTTLQDLNVAYDYDITNQGIIWISTCPQLKKLDIHRCTAVSDPAIYALAESACSKTLVSLYCGGCPKVTTAALYHLCRRCPALQASKNNETVV